MRQGWENPPYNVTSLPLGGFATLTNVGSTPVVIGVARADFTNVKKLEFLVRVTKVGTGVQSWQLWNETNGAQLALLTDNGAAGERTLSTGELDISGLGLTGMKTLFLRASSTVGADDPIYRGGCACLS